MGRSRIGWTDEVWNPMTGCTPVSRGCDRCYARTMAGRLLAKGDRHYRDGFKPTVHPDRLEQPLHWRRPRVVFVCSMGDLFHDDVPTSFVHEVLQVAVGASVRARGHQFVFLTKRPHRLREVLHGEHGFYLEDGRPYPHLWFGTSAEDQSAADRRVPQLVEGAAGHRLVVSIEPMLGPVDLGPWIDRLDWVIVGGESGPQPRPMPDRWVRPVRDACISRNVMFNFKQRPGSYPGTDRLLDGRTWDDMPRAVVP